MKRKLVIIALLIIVLMILVTRKRSSYTASQIADIFNKYPASIRINQQVNGLLYDIIINQIEGKPVMTNFNEIISIINSQGAAPALVPYTSESDIVTMFKTAYASTESSLTYTDKAMLRVCSLVGFEIAYRTTWGQGGMPNISHGTDGRPAWTDEVLAEVNLSINEAIKNVFKMAKKLNESDDGTGSWSADWASTVNTLLPSKYTPFIDFSDFSTRMSASGGDPAATWLFKFISIGPLYILWVAENKWNLDQNFTITFPASRPK